MSIVLATVSFFTTAVLLYFVAIIPGQYSGLGAYAPAPFFDILPTGIHLSNPSVQMLNIIGALLVPLLVSLLFYFLNKKQTDPSVYAPLLFYPLYVIFIAYIYLVML